MIALLRWIFTYKQSLPVYVFLFFFSCKQTGEKISPSIESISESVYASGIIRSENQYQVYGSANGIIEAILVKEGDLVKKGDPLMRLMNEPSRLNARNSKLAAEFAALEANADKLKELEAAIELAQSRLVNDSLLAIRQRTLWAHNVGSRVELEQRELAFQSSKTNYETARIRYDDLKRQLEFASQQSLNNLKISNSIASDFIIKAEADGKVYKLLKEKGEFANTISPVAIIGDADNFYAELTVDEYDIARIREGQQVLISMDSYQGEVYEASVVQIIPLMDESSRSFTLKANFVSRPKLLYPNLSLEANIIIRSKERAITIPRTYLIGDSLVRMSNGEKRKVVIGLMDYRKAEIKSGLTTEDVIIHPHP